MALSCGQTAPVCEPDRVEALGARRQRADPPAAEQLGAEQRRGHPSRPIRGRDAAPQQVSGVGLDGVDRALLAVERHRIGAGDLQPERRFDARPKPVGCGLEAPGQVVLTAQPSQSRQLPSGPIGVALDLDERERADRRPAVPEPDGVGRILPAVARQRAGVAGAVFHEAIAVENRRARSSHCRQASACGQSRSSRSAVAGPALVLAEQDQPQRRGVHRAIGRHVRDRARGGEARPCAARGRSCPVLRHARGRGWWPGDVPGP